MMENTMHDVMQETYRSVMNNFLDVFYKKGARVAYENAPKISERFQKVSNYIADKIYKGLSFVALPALFGNYENVHGIGNKISYMAKDVYHFWKGVYNIILHPEVLSKYEAIVQYAAYKFSNPQSISLFDEVLANTLLTRVALSVQEGIHNAIHNAPYYLGYVFLSFIMLYGGVVVTERIAVRRALRKKIFKMLSDEEKRSIIRHGIMRFPFWGEGRYWRKLSKIYEEIISQKLPEDEYKKHLKHAEQYQKYIEDNGELRRVKEAEEYFKNLFKKESHMIEEFF